jgi:hypothetical protein
MKPKRAYYSLIQFCPDASRLEAVNVGVVLLCPEADFIGARTSAGNRRAEKLVGRGELDRHALNAAKQAIEQRLETDRASLKSHEDLMAFVNTRGNNLKLTQPRPVKVFDPAADLDDLFSELVGGRSRTQRAEPVAPQLEDAFQRLHNEGRAQLNLRVDVPLLGRSLRVPYAYQNGVLNLVRPYRFPKKEGAAIESAMRLAVEGDLLQRHGQNGGPAKKLIVVSLFSHNGAEPAAANRVSQLLDRVSQLLAEYHVSNVQESQIHQFVSQVEQEAHPACT